MKVWHQCMQFDPSKGQAIHWLLSAARHSAIDSLRRKQVRSDRVVCGAKEIDDPFANLPSPDASPMESLILLQQGASVRWLLGALPTEQRQSLTLVFYGGLSHKEVAQHLDRPLGTVKSWVRRALISLRTSLDSAPWQRTAAGIGTRDLLHCTTHPQHRSNVSETAMRSLLLLFPGIPISIIILIALFVH